RFMKHRRKSLQLVTGFGAVDVIGDSVSVSILTGQETSSRRRAERRSHECVAEHRAFFCEAVDVWCLDVGMSGATQFVPPQIINEYEDNVRPRSICLCCAPLRKDRRRGDQTTKNGGDQLFHRGSRKGFKV